MFVAAPTKKSKREASQITNNHQSSIIIMLSRQFARSLRRGPTAVSARVAGSRAVLAHSWSESSTAQTNAAIQTRPLSSLAPHIARAYPQYAIHGEAHMLNIKMIVPGYRLIKGESIAVDNSKKGRMLLEFTPRGSSGNYLWSDTVRFALSCEEVGLLISQLPQYEVELSRAATNSQDIEDTSKFGAITNDMPDKVLRITPGEGASVKFMLDFVRDGVGGQSPGVGQDGVS